MPGRKSNTETGWSGEQFAHQFLEARGYSVVEHNWRCAEGEIDIVARDGDDWVFVEVKTRRGSGFGTPEDSITTTKQKRLLRSGLMYIGQHALDDASWRIDVVAVELGAGDVPKAIRIIRDAVRASEAF